MVVAWFILNLTNTLKWGNDVYAHGIDQSRGQRYQMTLKTPWFPEDQPAEVKAHRDFYRHSRGQF